MGFGSFSTRFERQQESAICIGKPAKPFSVSEAVMIIFRDGDANTDFDLKKFIDFEGKNLVMPQEKTKFLRTKAITFMDEFAIKTGRYFQTMDYKDICDGYILNGFLETNKYIENDLDTFFLEAAPFKRLTAARAKIDKPNAIFTLDFDDIDTFEDIKQYTIVGNYSISGVWAMYCLHIVMPDGVDTQNISQDDMYFTTDNGKKIPMRNLMNTIQQCQKDYSCGAWITVNSICVESNSSSAKKVINDTASIFMIKEADKIVSDIVEAIR
ncbi:MAG: hypothetical protein R3Y11_04255 [Pseudomonadota bacterium]